MKKFSIVFFVFLSFVCTAQTNNSWFKNAVTTASVQLKKAAEVNSPGSMPRSIEANGKLRLDNFRDWTSGFFPGSLWLSYELTHDKTLSEEAKKYTLALDSVQYLTHTHDVGFMLFCSYGNAYRLTKDPIYLKPLENGALNLYNRYNSKVKAIRSWDFGHWQFPVIIDNMMNLELLYWAGKQFHKPAYAQAASNHAITTMKNHFRKDMSSYHVVSYDTITGKAIEKGTHQGLTHESAWARGQAWGLYGYVLCYENTKDPRFLQMAQKIAAFIMNHPNLPADKIPLWDFDVHNQDRSPRDASAAAVIASALLELSKFTKNNNAYINFAEDVLKSLSSPAYLAQPGTNQNFVLKHSVGAFLYNSEIDTPINYADYYYLEAMNRYAAIKKINLNN